MTTNRSEHDTRRAATKFGGVGAAALAALLATASPSVAQFAGSPSLVDVSGAGAQGNADSWAVAVSADGTLVAFASDADNLVPLDTNSDTDVFLHDTVSGITKRVSVNYQGEEAQGDGGCPSLSGDGRYVAFRSRAWNMRQNGENVGTPVWDVYLYDRQGPQTIRVSTPLEGGAAVGDSGCPAISADGSRIAFASDASDLVEDDTNGLADVFVYDVASGALARASLTDDGAQSDGASEGPAISADGSVVAFASLATNLTPETSTPAPILYQKVYARDLSAGTTELVSRAFAAPLPLPNADSCCPRISADGRVVIFQSSASNLISDATVRRPVRLFLRDRTAEVTEAVEPLTSAFGGCGPFSDPLVCDSSFTKGAALSADGRFVAFLSGSFLLLPENPPLHQEQVFLLDRQTRRVRRLTVDPTGYPVNAYPCGGSSSTLALSADGRVLAFVGGDTSGLGVDDANGYVRDVVHLEWTCDSEGHCRAPSLCPGSPPPACEPAVRSQLGIRRNPPLGPRRDRFQWRWIGPPDGPAFVDPAEGEYHLCVYTGGTLNAQIDAGIPSGAPWRSVQNGWRRKEHDGALELVTLRQSSNRSMVTVKSSSPTLDVPYLPLEAPQGVTVQLHESTTDRCWEAAFPASALKVNTRGEVTPEGTTPGIVRASSD